MARESKRGGGRTEEERRMLLLQRAQAEEEMAKKKEETLTLFLKDKLQKEEKNTAGNLLKLNEGWRSILRQGRARELRGDMEVLRQTFERQLDGLDSSVKTLQRDLQEAELQWAQVSRVHLQQLERLRSLQHKRVELVKQQWENLLQELHSRFISERRQMTSASARRRADLEDAGLPLEQQHQELMEQIQDLYRSSVMAHQMSHQQRIALLLQEEETTQDQTPQDQTLAPQLQEEHQQLLRMKDVTEKKAKNLQDTANLMSRQLITSETRNQALERELRDATQKVTSRTLELRDQLTRGGGAARRRLTQLAVQSDAAAMKLKAVVAKGEKVLRGAELCRRLERDQEDLLTSPPEETEGPDEETSALQAVTLRTNVSVLKLEALRTQRDALTRDNLQLKLLLQQRLDALTVSDPAPLAVGGAPTTAVLPEAGRRLALRRHVVIEGAHAARRH
ncbi:dynein regulatory complex subunit 2 [Pungitius pungitius]|uniref:dynein regulatory complex subunit 2 n=1 Tax=Pungitius pungitius TaxID=134920 RepID=UPI002E0FD9EC